MSDSDVLEQGGSPSAGSSVTEIRDRAGGACLAAGPVGLRPEMLERTRRELEDARSLPRTCFTSDSVFDLEQELFFNRMWLCVAREEEVPEPGDFVNVKVGSERILIIRGGDGRTRAFFNVCRHRGSWIVDEPCGSGVGHLRCPYHSWTFDLNGRLLSAPRPGNGFRQEDYGLVPVGLGNFGGFLFVNLDAQAEPLETWLADLPDLSGYGLGELRSARRSEYEVAANWKLVIENYNECYHCAHAHPQLQRVSDFRSVGKQEAGVCYIGGPMRLNDGCVSMTMSGQTDRPAIAGLSAEDRRIVHYYTVYPNLLLSPHPDYVLTHVVWPLASDRTRIVCEWLFPPQALEQEGFDPGDAVEFWDLTNRQDWELCERAQQGMASRGYRSGPYQPDESCVWTFDRWYADAVAARLAEDQVAR